jgi:hypothetical protein
MKSLKIIFGLIWICILILSSCKIPDSIGTIDITRNLYSKIYFGPLNPQQSFDSLYQLNIKEFRTDVEMKTSTRGYLTDLNFTKVTLSISDSANYSFDDFEQFDLLIGKDTLVVLPAISTNKNMNFELPPSLINYNYKDLYDKKSPIELRYMVKGINSLDSIAIQATYSFRIKGVVKL